MQHSGDGFIRTIFEGPEELPAGVGPGGPAGGKGGGDKAEGAKKGAPPKGKAPPGKERPKSGPVAEDGAAPPPPGGTAAQKLTERGNSTPTQVRKAMDTLRARRKEASGESRLDVCICAVFCQPLMRVCVYVELAIIGQEAGRDSQRHRQEQSGRPV